MSKQKQEDCPECEDWLATYGDMVTLLMCFFVLLASASKVDVVLFEQIQSGMNKGIGDVDNPKPVQLMVYDLTSTIQSMELGEKVSLGSDSRGILLEFASASFYEKGSADIKPEGYPIIRRMAEKLGNERYKYFRFSVEGHTDDTPISTQQYPSNWELSAGRATSMVRFLQSRGINPTRLRAIGMADISPKVPNRDVNGDPLPQNQAKNRRVVIRIEPAHL